MNRSVLIVAHGQPSDPAPAAEVLARFGGEVAPKLPGWDLATATLAEPGALVERARLMAPGVVFPMFMAGGWFTRIRIPAVLAEANLAGWQVLEPFGCDPALHDLAVQIAAESGASQILLAAHGSCQSSVPGDIARHVARRIGSETGARRAEAGFIDQAPRLDAVRGFGRDAACLPFFAAAGGHVTEDIPAAFAKAGFKGRLLPAIGLDARVPALIAAAIQAHQPVCTGNCRWRRG